ncbi:hypothetical protein V9K46_002263 [Vibrio parahaemolyticus]|nr:hypothetical protein [Vibrio sp. B1ASS3]
MMMETYEYIIEKNTVGVLGLHQKVQKASLMATTHRNRDIWIIYNNP